MKKELVEAMNQAVEAEAKNNLPKKIMMKTKTGEIITLEAIDNGTYLKNYYSSADKYSSGEARRVKKVKLPVSQDGIKFGDVEALFAHLYISGRYKYA